MRWEDYQDCDDDDVPIILLQQKYAHQRGHQHGGHQENNNFHNSQSYQSRFWNDKSSVTEEMEQPQMSNLERLMKEMIEQTKNQNRELDEIFDWNFEAYHEEPYDTFSNAIEHLEDVEGIENDDYYPNNYTPYSFKCVFQDDSEDEEEDYYAYDNYPQSTSQVILQESHSFELEPIEESDLEDFDHEDSEFKNSDFGEIMEEEVEEMLVITDFEAAESAATSFSLERQKSEIVHQNSYAIVDYDADIKELQEVLGISDQELDELVENGVGDDLILEAEFQKKFQASSPQVQAEIDGGNFDDHSTEQSKSGLMPNLLPCKCECTLLIEPKPPGYLFEELVFGGGIVKSSSMHGQINELCKVERLARLDRRIECVHLNYFEEPPDYCCILVKGFSENMGITSHSYLKVAFIRIIIRPLKEWKVYFHVISFSWRMFYRNEKPKENILLIEYDWKGVEVLIDDPP